MKNNKSLVIIAIILGVLVVVMGSYIAYDDFAKTESKVHTYNDIKGLYTYTSETIKDDELGHEYFAFYYLYLNENGTFNYRMGTGAPWGYVGNYVIKDNTIILNYLFRTNSGAEITVTTGSKTIAITDNHTLTDVNPSVTVADMTTVTLKKASAAEESEFSRYEDLAYILKNYHITNYPPNNSLTFF